MIKVIYSVKVTSKKKIGICFRFVVKDKESGGGQEQMLDTKVQESQTNKNRNFKRFLTPSALFLNEMIFICCQTSQHKIRQNYDVQN